MKKLSSNEVRNLWLNFFKEKGHMVEEGASLIPANDPTLLWINAGVAALKKYFDGTEQPKSHRIVNVQKSLRTNDIENVGYTSRHHTFFEMLGNFSIGDYFRKEAVTWGYELLTSPKWFDFDVNDLYFTVHPTDQETKKLWISLGVDPTHIVESEENFWEIGEGPCGPNTEIYFDRGPSYDKRGPELIRDDIDNDRYIELWNIVFSQYNAKLGMKRSDYPELPHKNIDTGAGLERIVCILQDGETNFDTDLFLPIIHATEKMCGKSYDKKENKRAFRVIADHIRTCTFAIADGAQFSNEGRGYVLRRVLRRAVRYGKQLGLTEPFLYKLVSVVVKNMQEFYPYLTGKIDYVAKLVKIEEEKFEKTLAAGEQMLLAVLQATKGKEISGKDAFKLYDTYGFPYELTEEMAKEKGYSVNRAEFDVEMEAQKERARNAMSKAQSMNRQSKDLLDFVDKSEFSYDPTPIKAKVIAIFKDGARVKELKDSGALVFDKTTFYAESGGQVADQGIIKNASDEFKVVDVQHAPSKQNLHFVDPQGETIHVGDEFELVVDMEKRRRTTRNHSSVHLLDEALREILGSHVAQAGSYVDSERFRFDFTHFEKMTPEQILQVEELVNKKIDEALVADIRNMPIAEAKKSGAIALFSEKYGDIVRVVNFGNWSIEFCGGCHVNNTRDIGSFVILSEESISSGVRRIEGTTSINAYHAMKQREAILDSVGKSLGALSYNEIKDRLATYTERSNELQSQLANLKKQMVGQVAKDLLGTKKNVKGIETIVAKVEKYDKDMLQYLVDDLKSSLNEYFIFICNVDADRVSLAAASSKQAVANGLLAGNVIKEAAKIVGGGGGGRPDFAQAGGKDVTKADATLDFVKTKLV
ncbi:MAG: alanine--tRNA ligase [Bacilli bacterium]